MHPLGDIHEPTSVIFDEESTFKCGHCDTEVASQDIQLVKLVFQEHQCEPSPKLYPPQSARITWAYALGDVAKRLITVFGVSFVATLIFFAVTHHTPWTR
jgi:hypothetical protein